MRVLCVLVCSLLMAQQDATFSTGVKVVNVLASVHDKHNQVVENLTKDDFILEEDGHPQLIKYFSRDTNLPLTVGVLVDISGSQRRLVDAESRASYRFFEQVLREDKDLAFVIHFDREVELLQDLTSSRRKLETALDSLARPVQTQSAQQNGGWGGRSGRGSGGGGNTSLYDATLLASDDIMHQQTGRKAVIILSDGVDTSSKVSLSRAIEAAQRSNVMIYSILFEDHEGGFGRSGISLGGPLGGMGGMGGGRRGGGRPVAMQRPDGKKILQRMAQETGGGFFEVSSKQPIEKVYGRIEEELRAQYSLGYSPDHPDGAGFRNIRVTTRNHDLIVQARNGYYPEQ